MRRLRSMGEIEKVDALCRQIPYCPRNPHRIGHGRKARPRSPDPQEPPRGQNQPPAFDSQALYRARRPCREIRRRHRGQPARRVAGFPAGNGLVAAICGRDRRPKLPPRNRRPNRVGPHRSTRARNLSRTSHSRPFGGRRSESVAAGALRGGARAWHRPSAACWKRSCNFAAPWSSARPNLPRACPWCRTPKNPNTWPTGSKPSCAAGPRP